MEKDVYYNEAFKRSAIIFGSDSLNILKSKSVLVCGIGGVGSHAAMALARGGVGKIIVCDSDVVAMSNLNRQELANINTIGRPKTEVMAEMIKSINPFCEVLCYQEFIASDNIIKITSGADYVIDAIDTVTSKLELISYCCENNIKIISSMGTGNKIDPTRLEISDIYKTSVCPLAKVMRHELKKRNIYSLQVLYSKEEPRNSEENCLNPEIETGSLNKPKRKTVGSVSFVPPVAGYIIAGEVIKNMINL